LKRPRYSQINPFLESAPLRVSFPDFLPHHIDSEARSVTSRSLQVLWQLSPVESFVHPIVPRPRVFLISSTQTVEDDTSLFRRATVSPIPVGKLRSKPLFPFSRPPPSSRSLRVPERHGFSRGFDECEILPSVARPWLADFILHEDNIPRTSQSLCEIMIVSWRFGLSPVAEKPDSNPSSTKCELSVLRMESLHGRAFSFPPDDPTTLNPVPDPAVRHDADPPTFLFLIVLKNLRRQKQP